MDANPKNLTIGVVSRVETLLVIFAVNVPHRRPAVRLHKTSLASYFCLCSLCYLLFNWSMVGESVSTGFDSHFQFAQSTFRMSPDLPKTRCMPKAALRVCGECEWPAMAT
jgi:hypothetical protein